MAEDNRHLDGRGAPSPGVDLGDAEVGSTPEDHALDPAGRSMRELQIQVAQLTSENEELRMRLAEYQELYERSVDLHNFAPIGYVVLDLEGVVVDANLTLGRILGVARSRIVGRPFEHFVLSEDLPLLHRRLEALCESGEAQSWRTRCFSVSGDAVTCQVDGQPVYTSQGEIVNCRLALTNISALVEMEAIRTAQHQELQRAMAELQATQAQLLLHERSSTIGQLAEGVAHDFNNILSSILLYAQMTLRSQGLSPVQQRWIEAMISESRRGSELVQQILDFGQRAALQPELVEMAPFVRDVSQLLSRTLPDDVDVRTVVDDDSATVKVDRARLQQALVNLALNARDAMPGGGTVTLSVDCAAPDATPRCAICGEPIAGPWVTVSVADTGHGVPEDVLPRLFEPFFTTQTAEGHGLGLPQVAGIVGQHGGHLTVDTTVGEGTTVRLYLPDATRTCVDLSAAGEDDGSMTIAAGEPVVLLVEDNPRTRAAVAEALSLLGYRVVPASHGEEALKILSDPDHGISVVLTDWVMPEMGGEPLVDAMRERGISLPVVVISGHPIREFDRREGVQVIEWLQKPVDLVHLARAIAAALG